MLSRPATTFSVSLASGLAIFLAAHGLVQGVAGSPDFLVLEMEVRWSPETKLPSQKYRLVPPKSIFQLDLETIARTLEKRHPAARVEKVEKVLPNQVTAFLRPAYLVAQMKSDRYYLLSEEGAIVSEPQSSPWAHLPILFLDDVQGPFYIGRRIRHPSFEAASELLSEMRRQGGAASRGISSVRVKGNLLTLFLDSGLEVRLRTDRTQEGLSRLQNLLAQKPEILDHARYVDLRFEDLAVG